MDAETDSFSEEWMPTLFVGWHSTQKNLPLSSHFVEQAKECNYDMITTSITNSNFQSRVVDSISASFRDDTTVHRATAEHDSLSPLISPLTADDTDLAPADFNARVLGFTSPWIDLCSPDPAIADASRQVLHMEVAFAAFCGLTSIFVAGPRLYHEDAATQGLAQYARAVEQSLLLGANVSVSIVFPMVDDPSTTDRCALASMTRAKYLDDAEVERPRKVDPFGTWDAWNSIRTTCSYSSRLFAALELPRSLPIQAIQSRWLSEPLKAIMIAANSFVANRSGYPTLFPHSQTFLGNAMRLKLSPWILLRNVGPIPGWDDPNAVVELPDGFLSSEARASARGSSGAHENALLQSRAQKDPLAHLRYIRYLQRNQPRQSEVEKYGSGYQDYLQVPLQPLTNNLESLTYEVFEKDPVKYDLYEEAIRKTLRDWVDQRKEMSGQGKIVVAVVGAGRGPLVTRALRAAEAENAPIDLWAVEKNPHAFVLLQRHNRNSWGGRVHLVQSDMRSWEGPRVDKPVDKKIRRVLTKLDIVISELLGSFGDNELSPECLDGIIAPHLAPHGISIPRSYKAFLTPVAAPKIHADVAARVACDATAPETPAVVWLHGIDYLSCSAQKPASFSSPASRPSTTDDAAPPPVNAPNVLSAWSFTQGGPSRGSVAADGGVSVGSNRHNRRHARLTFRAGHRGVCHGLAGYFEAELYPGVVLSTNPNTMDRHSKNMISWFPFFFPLKTPIYIPDNAALTVSLWRQTDDKKVWYEWQVESWGWTFMLAEKESKRVRLGVSELHSSVKNAYLM